MLRLLTTRHGSCWAESQVLLLLLLLLLLQRQWQQGFGSRALAARLQIEGTEAL